MYNADLLMTKYSWNMGTKVYLGFGNSKGIIIKESRVWFAKERIKVKKVIWGWRIKYTVMVRVSE